MNALPEKQYPFLNLNGVFCLGPGKTHTALSPCAGLSGGAAVTMTLSMSTPTLGSRVRAL